MARLPVVGSDSGTWGDLLNEFLGIGHSEDGVNKGPLVETIISGNYTLLPADNGTRLVVVDEVTITVPSVGTLGDGFECEIINDSGDAITIEGSSDVAMADGEVACLIEANGKQRVAKGATTLIS